MIIEVDCIDISSSPMFTDSGGGGWVELKGRVGVSRFAAIFENTGKYLKADPVQSGGGVSSDPSWMEGCTCGCLMLLGFLRI